MNILRRLGDLLRADLHGLLDSIEDKELLLEDCLKQMRSSLDREAQELERLARNLSRIRNEADKLRTMDAPELLLRAQQENQEALRALCEHRQHLMQQHIQDYERLQMLCRERGYAVRLAPPLPEFSPFAWDFATSRNLPKSQGET